MKGRKPAIKPLGDEDVIDLPSAMERIPEPPASLRGLARKLWPSVVAELVARNTYDSDCRDVVIAYCMQYAKFLEAEEDIAENGRIVTRVTARGDIEMNNPAIKHSDAACNLMLRFAAELGLTPASRKRVVKVRAATGAPARQFLKRAG